MPERDGGALGRETLITSTVSEIVAELKQLSTRVHDGLSKQSAFDDLVVDGEHSFDSLCK